MLLNLCMTPEPDRPNMDGLAQDNKQEKNNVKLTMRRQQGDGFRFCNKYKLRIHDMKSTFIRNNFFYSENFLISGKSFVGFSNVAVFVHFRVFLRR